jgi:magnesium chelatase family protein
VLFLDELSEFQRSSLDALRQPLEDGAVTIVRGQSSMRFPSRFMLVAATNPCPCGFAGVDDRCTCGEAELRRHRRRLSGPLLDRMDLMVDVRRPSEEELRGEPGTTSERSRARVAAARERQRRRLAETAATANGDMDAEVTRSCVNLDRAAARELGRAYAVGLLSARGRHRVLRVARTIADLHDRPTVSEEDLLTALGLRQRIGAEAVMAL